MLFSVLVAHYNNGKYFRDFYDSIVGQTYKDWEVIIVDDCSTDDSVNFIKQLSQFDSRFKLYLNEKNMGCGFTKRKCAELANGQICGFVDPDDTIVPEAISLMVAAHREHPGASLVHSSFYFCDEKLNRRASYDVPKQVDVSERFTNLEGCVNHFATYKINFYKKTAGIDATLLRAVDQDLYLRLSEIGEFYFIDKFLYNYRIHDNGISTSGNVDKAFYWFLKVIANTEERRKVNLENEIAAYLNRTDPRNIATNLANPRYLLLQLIQDFKLRPLRSLKRLFLNR
jgi:glycosyltransferase involved in cell wall biosynthesis